MAMGGQRKREDREQNYEAPTEDQGNPTDLRNIVNPGPPVPPTPQSSGPATQNTARASFVSPPNMDSWQNCGAPFAGPGYPTSLHIANHGPPLCPTPQSFGPATTTKVLTSFVSPPTTMNLEQNYVASTAAKGTIMGASPAPSAQCSSDDYIPDNLKCTSCILGKMKCTRELPRCENCETYDKECFYPGRAPDPTLRGPVVKPRGRGS